MGIPGVSGFLKRLGKIGKFGLLILILGFVVGIVLSSISTPAEYTRERRIDGRAVVPNQNLINQPINGIEMRVIAEPDLSTVTYSIGIVPSHLTSLVRNEDDLEFHAAAYERDVEGTVEFSHSHFQLFGDAETFDLVIFTQRSISLRLTITYNAAVGTFVGLIILVGIVLMVLGFVLCYWQDRRARVPFMDAYAPDGLGEPEPKTPRFVDDGAEGPYAMEQMTARHMPQETGSSASDEGEKCPYCGGGPISSSDIFCPFCFVEL